jgi:hypothetical protein
MSKQEEKPEVTADGWEVLRCSLCEHQHVIGHIKGNQIRLVCKNTKAATIITLPKAA